MIVVGQRGVISEVIFCVESESEVRIGPSRQDFEIFEVIHSKNGFLGYFWGYVQDAQNFLALFF